MTAAKERPIIFSAPMVRAILEGRKTQTRRIVKQRPIASGPNWNVWYSDKLEGQIGDAGFTKLHCPIQPGDVLWVRETWRPNQGAFTPEADYNEFGVDYRADGRTLWFDCDDLDLYPHGDKDVDKAKWLPRRNGDDIWRSPIHMPRWASRLRLLVKSVRVERLQDISAEDCAAEGISVPRCGCEVCSTGSAICPADGTAYIFAFHELWESIYGPGSWDVNPWVWAYEFERTA